MEQLKWIKVEDKEPVDGTFMLVMCTDGINICRYSKTEKVFIDREFWHVKDVTHYLENYSILN